MLCRCSELLVTHTPNNAVGNKAKKLVDGRATLPKKISEVEIICKVSSLTKLDNLYVQTPYQPDFTPITLLPTPCTTNVYLCPYYIIHLSYKHVQISNFAPFTLCVYMY